MNFLKRKFEDRKRDIKRTINIAKTIADTPKFIQNMMYGHDKLPYSFREVFDRVKDERITSLEIIRNPLSKPLQSILSSLTGFELERKLKQEKYDSLFHLKIRINGKYDFEKEQAPHFRHAQNNPNQEVLRIHNVPNETIEKLVENTMKSMGNAFFNYDGLKNNCQDFILHVLHSNGIRNNEYDRFIKQNTDEIFKSTPSLMRGLMNKVTDIANRAQILTEGTGIEEISKKDELSNIDLMQLCSMLNIPLNAVIMKDQLTKSNFKDGCYIMNLENHNQSGSHWTAFVKKGKSVYYCDSYGVYPPENEYNIFLKTCDDIYINRKQIQAMKSEKCGWFATAFLYAMTHSKGSLLDRMKRFFTLWNYKNLNQNDKVRNMILSLIKSR